MIPVKTVCTDSRRSANIHRFTNYNSDFALDFAMDLCTDPDKISSIQIQIKKLGKISPRELSGHGVDRTFVFVDNDVAEPCSSPLMQMAEFLSELQLLLYFSR